MSLEMVWAHEGSIRNSPCIMYCMLQLQEVGVGETNEDLNVVVRKYMMEYGVNKIMTLNRVDFKNRTHKANPE